MTINLPVGVNWLTTIGGILAGIPVVIINSGMVLPMRWTQILSIVAGLGTLLIGLAAKDFNTHSTQAQVATSTQQVAAGQLPKA